MKANNEFDDLFSFEGDSDGEIEHTAQMISYRFLSEIEKICEERNIKRKDLAKMVGTSEAYITQLFRGNSSLNIRMIARFEFALGLSFKIKATKKDS